MTLAYQFPSAQFNNLKSLVEKLDPSCASPNWELRLYSRDPRLATKQVHKVLYPHTPREPDELELRIGDYIYLSSEAIKNSTDGWVEGISWLTGTNGYLPENYTERTCESDSWTLHRQFLLCDVSLIDNGDVVDGLRFEPSQNSLSGILMTDESETGVSLDQIETSFDSNGKENTIPPENLYEMRSAKQNSDQENGSVSTTGNGAIDDPIKEGEAQENRKFYILRHGERVDFTFGSWIPYCFDVDGNYIRKDLNMPKSLPKRKTGPLRWQKDSPLTNVGLYQAKLIGEGLKETDLKIRHVYSSPSFRCIQTVTEILKGLELKDVHPIRIEPGLFECLSWYQDGLPEFCSKDELTGDGFNVLTDYEAIMSIDQLAENLHENLEEFYKRNSSVMKSIIQQTGEFESIQTDEKLKIYRRKFGSNAPVFAGENL